MARGQYAEEKARRKAALRAFRAVQRQADSAIERLERRIFTLQGRKTIITRVAVITLRPLWNEFIRKVKEMETTLADLLTVIDV